MTSCLLYVQACIMKLVTAAAGTGRHAVMCETHIGAVHGAASSHICGVLCCVMLCCIRVVQFEACC